MTLADSLTEIQRIDALQTIADWAPRVFWALIALGVIGVFSIISDLSTGQNERRDRKASRAVAPGSGALMKHVFGSPETPGPPYVHTFTPERPEEEDE